MSEQSEKVPGDVRLLSDAIIELNISRRNVSIYPPNHTSVERSLSQSFELMEKLFQLRPDIILKLTKEVLALMKRDAGSAFSPSLLDNCIRSMYAALSA